MDLPAQGQGAVYRSGQWEIDLRRRELRAKGVPVPIGDRAFEIIQVLVRSAGELLTKDELLERVWPSTIVDDNTLRVHVSAIRKVFGTDRGMLKTASGRGYRLLGNWVLQGESRSAQRNHPAPMAAGAAPLSSNLPLVGSDLIGRDDAIRQISILLSAYRAVTLTGPGGIGKTSVALEAARRLRTGFYDDAWLVELASLSNPALVPAVVALVLGLSIGGGEITAAAVARAIGERKLLLVLDNCEHLIDAAAELTEALVHVCPGISVLATSRELLRVDGENGYQVAPLRVPPAKELDPEAIQEHGAVRLFLARLKAANTPFLPEPRTVKAIGAICRRLDGIPLAIEFAASRAATLGLDLVLSRLDDRFGLLGGGRRTALPRHQTLRATLDWSYELLSDREQRLLCCLSVFVGGFTIEAAAAVMNETALSIADGIGSLVVKSLVVIDAPGKRWRLLETIRDYASEKLAVGGDAQLCARRHAEFLLDYITTTSPGQQPSPTTDVRTLHIREIDNVRAALAWAFSRDGDKMTGIALTAAFAPLWMHLSLMSECQAHVERALFALAQSDSAEREIIHYEMLLFSALGDVLIYTGGAGPETQAAWEKALERAERIGNIDYRLRGLWGIWVGRIDAGEFRQSLTLAKRFCDLAGLGSDPVEPLIGHRMMGSSFHFLGDQHAARHHLEAVVHGYDARIHKSGDGRFRSDHGVRARTRLAVVLWLQGYPERAMWAVDASIAEATAGGHVGTLAAVLAQGACRVALACGDLDAASRFIAMLLAISERHDLRFLHTLGRCFEGTLLVMQGRVDRGLHQLRKEMNEPAVDGHGMWFTIFLRDLGDAYGVAGDFTTGLATLDDALERTDRLEEGWCRAELLHLKGRLTLQRGLPDDMTLAESLLRQSLDLAMKQAAVSWELRAATTLSRLWRDSGRATEARQLLSSVYGRLTEGFATADARAAEVLLGDLAAS